MGLVYAGIELINTGDLEMVRRHYMDADDVKRIYVNMMADSGAYMMAINDEIQAMLDLPFIEKRKVQVADGRVRELDVVGPVEFVLRTGKLPAMRSYYLATANHSSVPSRWKKWMCSFIPSARH